MWLTKESLLIITGFGEKTHFYYFEKHDWIVSHENTLAGA